MESLLKEFKEMTVAPGTFMELRTVYYLRHTSRLHHVYVHGAPNSLLSTPYE